MFENCYTKDDELDDGQRKLLKPRRIIATGWHIRPLSSNFRPIGIDLKTAINLMPSSARKIFQMCSRQTCKFFEKFHSSPTASKRQSDNELDTIKYLRWRQTFLGLQFFILKIVAQHWLHLLDYSQLINANERWRKWVIINSLTFHQIAA